MECSCVDDSKFFDAVCSSSAMQWPMISRGHSLLLFEDGSDQFTEPQTEHVSSCPITVKLTVIVIVKFSDKKPGHRSSEPNCAHGRYRWTTSFLVGNPHLHQVKISSNSCQEKAPQQSKQKPSQNRTSNLQLRFAFVVGLSLVRHRKDTGANLGSPVDPAIAMHIGDARMFLDSVDQRIEPQIRIK